MKIKKRAIALVLILGFVIATISGCGSKETTSSGDIQNNDDEVAADTSYKADFKGGKIVIASWADPTPKLGVSELGDATYYAYQYAAKKHNATIEYKSFPEDEYATQFVQASLSGTKFADIAAIHSNNHASWVNQGLLNDVTEFMKNEDPKRWEMNISKFKDKMYGINKTSASNIPNLFLLYNTEIIKELNMESPQELDKNGKWTWEKFREYSKAAIKDTNNDGKTERYGMSSFMLPDGLRYSNEAIAYVNVDGKFYNANTYSTTKQNILVTLDFVRLMSVDDKSVLGTVTGGMDVKNQAIEAFKSNNLLFMLADQALSKTYKSDGVKNYAPVLWPKGPNAKERNNYLPGYSFWGLPVGGEYELKDLVAFWKDCNITWDQSRGNAYYEASAASEVQRVWDEQFLNKSDAEYLINAGAKMKNISLYNGSINIGSIEVWDMYQKIMLGEATPAQVVAATDGQIQAKIDEVLNSK